MLLMVVLHQCTEMPSPPPHPTPAQYQVLYIILCAYSCYILILLCSLYGNCIRDTGVKALLESLLMNCKDIRELE